MTDRFVPRPAFPFRGPGALFVITSYTQYKRVLALPLRKRHTKS
jgi:hypothetical protein